MSTVRVLCFLPALLLPGLLLAGCQDGEPAPSFTEYFPLTPGNQWSYLVQRRMPVTDIEYSVTWEALPPADFQGELVSPLRVTETVVHQWYNYFYYRWTPDGLCYYGCAYDDGMMNDSLYLAPPELMLKYGATAGSSWQATFAQHRNAGLEGIFTNTYHILGFESVETPYGHFDQAMKVKAGLGESTEFYLYWYVRGVGLVRSEHHLDPESGSAETYLLSSFEPAE